MTEHSGELPASYAWTGSRMIDVLNPNPDDIILDEIAIGLAREPRYGGATTSEPWSVGQHLLTCYQFARQDGHEDPSFLLALLLHDAPEYMLRDLIAPVKRYCRDYRGIEARWTDAVNRRFGIAPTHEDLERVKFYDMLACSSEKAAFISPEAGDWPGLPEPREIPWHVQNADDAAVAAAYKLTVQKEASLYSGLTSVANRDK